MEREVEFFNSEDEQKIEILNVKKVRAKRNTKWLVQIFFTSLSLSILFALIAELMLSHTSLALALFLILLLMGVSVVFDLIGVAVTACSIKPLLEMNKKNINGADIAVKLVKKADKVSCICTDVVGDICSILCGAGGVTITAILINISPTLNTFVVSLLINAMIASITILGKAIGKTYALNYSTKVVLKVARLFFLFKKHKKSKSKK
ncbi:MAG: hypothetical protein J6C13_04125 [Clostridia bacterium]|nr:hypothetical protein [Clostridia bacterium]